MNYIRTLVALLFILNSGFFLAAQEFMTNLSIAQKLALDQNKMILMVWEEETYYDYPVIVVNNNNQAVVVPDLFFNVELKQLIWKHFVPVIVPEYKYNDLYKAAEDKRSYKYIQKLGDETLKVLDPSGYIVNTSANSFDNYNITLLIRDYAFNLEYLEQELANYANENSFLNTYFLASKYYDFSMYCKPKVRDDVIKLGDIYRQNAEKLIEKEPKENQSSLRQRLNLLEIQTYILDGKIGKALRSLRRIEDEVHPNNKSFLALLNYTTLMTRGKRKAAQPWKQQMSSIQIQKAYKMINLNKY